MIIWRTVGRPWSRWIRVRGLAGPNNRRGSPTRGAECRRQMALIYHQGPQVMAQSCQWFDLRFLLAPMPVGDTGGCAFWTAGSDRVSGSQACNHSGRRAWGSPKKYFLFTVGLFGRFLAPFCLKNELICYLWAPSCQTAHFSRLYSDSLL